VVQLGRDGARFQKRLDFGGEEERAVFAVDVVERLDAEAVARDEQLTPRRVPDGEGEHAAQLLDGARAVFFIKMEDGLGVAVGSVRVAARFEPGAVVRVVVNLPVEDDVERAVLVLHRLVAARHVNDAQASVSEPRAAVNEQAHVVRPAVREHVAHPFELGDAQALARPLRQSDSVNPTHKSSKNLRARRVNSSQKRLRY
jgi:hypothetical protein